MNLLKQILAVVVLCGLGYLGYLYGWPLIQPADGTPSGQRDAGPKAAVHVVVHKAEMKAERSRVEAVGTGEATRSAMLYPAAAGEVVGVHFQPNQKVAEGDLLLELDKRSEELAVDLARVRLASARQLLQRYESTGGTGVVPASAQPCASQFMV